MASSCSIKSIETTADSLEMEWSDGHHSRFHYIWLRDNCPCPECLHPQTNERTFDVMTIAADQPVLTSLDLQQHQLAICWEDGHVSEFHPDWLRINCYSKSAREAKREKPVLWTAKVKTALPEIDYETVMKSEAAVLAWLDMLVDYGFVLIRNTPTVPGQVTRVANRIAYLRETNFGREFDVISKPDPNNVAYTALKLESHSDLPNWELPPGTQFLHCLEFDAEGGESTLVDGFCAARQLEQEDPAAYEILAKLQIPFRFHDQDWDVQWTAPTIARDKLGDLKEVRFHAALTAPLDLDFDDVLPFYRAYRAFTEIVRRPENILSLKLRPGDLLVFNNRRALHGRAAFNPDSGPRHLQGCYVDNDAVLSKRRILRAKA
ncbi:TauD/TfdA family dioxygenase [Sneathiella marina]|uniref:TauD/TfdA family dioxygenase n=1 Tax=Sneathiella marina TaxID=2950108 RepID=A0ABY4VZI2_9PROT|nr:TauD/TfdA family dioxygenase [Sneathiella marina]USG60350.1 TauD/TfdA family dioxygenase [Sneathiella marina]